MNTHKKIEGKSLELCNAFGFLYPGELFLIQAIAQSLKEGAVCVNIGAGVGTSGLALAEMRQDLRIYTIDISEGGPHGGMQNEKNAFEQAGIAGLPTQILGNSQIVYVDWLTYSGNSGIDYLFIDGDHAETALQGDIDGWLPYVNPGGYVLFHDYSSLNWGGVKKVVDANINRKAWRYVHKVDTLIAYQRAGQK